MSLRIFRSSETIRFQLEVVRATTPALRGASVGQCDLGGASLMLEANRSDTYLWAGGVWGFGLGGLGAVGFGFFPPFLTGPSSGDIIMQNMR